MQPSDTVVLPICTCSAHVGLHVHLPYMIDSQHSLLIYAEPADKEEVLTLDRLRALPQKAERSGRD